MEVGKLYKHKKSKIVTSRYVYKCEAILPSGNAVVSWRVADPEGEYTEGVVIKENFGNYREVKILRTGVGYGNVYDNPHGGPFIGTVFKTRKEADNWPGSGVCKRIACVEIKWTEGDGLEVND